MLKNKNTLYFTCDYVVKMPVLDNSSSMWFYVVFVTLFETGSLRHDVIIVYVNICIFFHTTVSPLLHCTLCGIFFKIHLSKMYLYF